MHVIGITGPFASGKGEVVKIFKHVEPMSQSYSLSEILHKMLSFDTDTHDEIYGILQELGYQHNTVPPMLDSVEKQTILFREKMQNLGNMMRATYGPAILAQMTVYHINQQLPAHIAIDSIRNPAELVYLRKKLGAKIIGVTAPDEKRLNNSIGRRRPGDPKTPEEFELLAQREWGRGETVYGQQVKECLDLADRVINNNSTLEEFHQKIHETFTSLGIEGVRKRPERDY